MQGVGRLTTLSTPPSQRALTQAVVAVGGLIGRARIPMSGSRNAVGCIGVSMALSLVGLANAHTAQCSVCEALG